jgi:hypothetical protein
MASRVQFATKVDVRCTPGAIDARFAEMVRPADGLLMVSAPTAMKAE